MDVKYRSRTVPRTGYIPRPASLSATVAVRFHPSRLKQRAKFVRWWKGFARKQADVRRLREGLQEREVARRTGPWRVAVVCVC